MRERFRPHSIPAKAHPLVRRLIKEMNEQQICMLDVAERAGINKNTMRRWREKSNPRINDLEACFNVLGLELSPRRMSE